MNPRSRASVILAILISVLFAATLVSVARVAAVPTFTSVAVATPVVTTAPQTAVASATTVIGAPAPPAETTTIPSSSLATR